MIKTIHTRVEASNAANLSTSISTSTSDTPHNDDIIVTINAGGRMFQVLKSTLCLPHDDTAFTKLFRNSNRTNRNNIFLDHDPELVEIILNFLRMKKIEDPFDPIVEPPWVPTAKAKNFRRLLNHFGLTAFFYYPSTVPDTTRSETIANTMTMTNHAATGSVHHVRKMSFDSHDDVEASTQKTSQDSCSSTQDSFSSIADGFDYCYG